MKTGETRSSSVSRRTFLGLAGTSLLLAGCTSELTTSTAKPKAMSAADLISQDLFYIAHRGSGDNWTEHTLQAYRQAIAHGAPAIEISVHRTQDGRFVCHHDTDLERLCAIPKEISEVTWDELQEMQNDARAWLGPNTPLEPIPSLDAVLAELGGQAVLFVEDKTGQYAGELIELLEGSAAPNDSIMWKQPAAGTGYELAAKAGMKTWGYFAPEKFSDIETLASRFDAIGIHDSADSAIISRAIATGLPVICWEVHTRSKRDALQRQGVQGMMCSNYPYVTTGAPSLQSATDNFASGHRAAGDLPDVVTWNSQPQLIPSEGILRLPEARKASYVLGSMATDGTGSWRVNASMRWPLRGKENQIAGLAFGLPADAPYRAFEAQQMDGYHVQLESRGEISLWRADGKSPKNLERTSWTVPAEGAWIQLELVMSSGSLKIRVGEAVLNADLGDTIQPGYLNLLTLIPAGCPVEFRSIGIERKVGV